MEETKLILAGAALNQTPLDWEANLLNIRSAIIEASTRNVDILLLPELCITGYGCEDMFLHPWFADETFDKLLQVKEWCDNMTVCLGVHVIIGQDVFNTACVIKNKEII